MTKWSQRASAAWISTGTLRPARTSAGRSRLSLRSPPTYSYPSSCISATLTRRFAGYCNPLAAGLCGGVAHCFTGTPDMARAYLEMGLHIGITGWLCDERRGGDLRDAVAQLPLDRLLIETDAPFLLPRDLPRKPRGRRNEPRFLPHLLQCLAAIMARSAEEIADATRQERGEAFQSPRGMNSLLGF